MPQKSPKTRVQVPSSLDVSGPTSLKFAHAVLVSDEAALLNAALQNMRHRNEDASLPTTLQKMATGEASPGKSKPRPRQVPKVQDARASQGGPRVEDSNIAALQAEVHIHKHMSAQTCGVRTDLCAASSMGVCR